MGDRSGSREVKGASLKKSKKNPGGVAARGKKPVAVVTAGPAISLSPPSPGNGPFFDCGAALLSRQFDRDRDRVLQRAKVDSDLCAVILWFSDIEKQQLLADVCKENIGFCYNFIGIHPDNIQNTNKRSHETWLVKVEEYARRPECVGVLSGLNLQKELATHFAQESLLKSAYALSCRIKLPLVLHIVGDRGVSLEKTIEILHGEGWNGIHDSDTCPVIIHDILTTCSNDLNLLQTTIKNGFYCALSGGGITDINEIIRNNARDCLRIIPIKQMLVCSDSPWRTPQNLPDPYLRTLRNEPSNLPSIVEAIAETSQKDVISLAKEIKMNSLLVFGMNSNSDDICVDVNASNIGGSGVTLDINNDENNDESNDCQEDELDILENDDDDGNDGEVGGRDIDDMNHSTGMVDSKLIENSYKKKATTNDSTGNSIGDNTPIAHYRCQKCRTSLFYQSNVVLHSLDTIRTVFKVGDEGTCNAAIFLKYDKDKIHNCSNQKEEQTKMNHQKVEKNHKNKKEQHNEALPPKNTNKKSSSNKTAVNDSKNTTGTVGDIDIDSYNFMINGNNVECSHCGIKIGRFSETDTFCPCGASVTGPSIRITTAKIDFFDASIVDTIELAERSRLEIEKLTLVDEDNEQNIFDIDQQVGKKKKQKKLKLKSENKGNFSSFRNKSFIPNASRVAKKGEMVGNVGGVEGNEENGDDSSDSDSEEEDNSS